jgi:transposase
MASPRTGAERCPEQIHHTQGDDEAWHGDADRAERFCAVQVQKNVEEKNVSVDSSGLGIRRKSSWYTIRTHQRPSKKRSFRKLHLACECVEKEKPIYSWVLTSALRHDSPRFRTLLKRIHGKIGDVCADKADSCRENTQLVKDMGGRPFLMPRKNASTKVKGHQAWREMMEFKELHPEEFKRRYHKRSSSESTNSSFKGKYGEFLSSRKWRGQKRQAGLKVIVYNARLLVRNRTRQEVEIWDKA